MRFIANALFAAVGAAVLVAGCSTDNPGGGAGEAGEGDCARGVLFRGGQYVEQGVVAAAGDQIGSGSLATCDDTSESARGLEFGGDGASVEVWSLPGLPSDEAVALEVEGSYAVLLNEKLTESRRTEIAEALELEE